ncbi:MAG: HEPN domain-containing protein [Treponema sp.]|jgi:HEPN domain-containing protein|nr:HEPN domain-containing protein [Treponema sp.]
MDRHESWLDRAKSSYELSKMTGNELVYYEDLCYQVQQAIEKSLKGLLIYYEFEPEFTHNIEILLSNLEKFTDIPDKIKKASRITVYAVQTRYPGEYEEITKEEYEESIKIAKDCLDWVENKFKEKSININYT